MMKNNIKHGNPSPQPSTNGPQDNFGSLRHAAARCGMLRHAAACFKLLVKGTSCDPSVV